MVFVTGAGGFLGANIVWALRQEGYPVRALVRRPPRGPQWKGLDGVEFVQGDVCDPGRIGQLMEGVRYVIHTAGVTDPVPRPRGLSYRVNEEGTRNVCAAALRSGVRRLVHTSSIATVGCGTAQAPATEQSAYNLGSIHGPYYTTKRRAERIIREFVTHGLDALMLCPAYIIGPRDVRPTTNRLILQAARYHFMVMPPGGMNVVDVREVARAHVRALTAGQSGERYLVAGPYRSYLELQAIVWRTLGVDRPQFVLPAWTKWFGSAWISLAFGISPWLPQGLSVPNFQYGYLPVHVSGERGDRVFQLTHRPVEQTVYDTLRWFQETGQAPWLRRPLVPPLPATN